MNFCECSANVEPVRQGVEGISRPATATYGKIFSRKKAQKNRKN
jgi:hypothetical protein